MVYSRQLIVLFILLGTYLTVLVTTSCKQDTQTPQLMSGKRITIRGNCRLVGATPLQTPQLNIHGKDVDIIMHENKTIYQQLLTRCHSMMEITGIVNIIPSNTKDPDTKPLYRLKLVSFKAF